MLKLGGIGEPATAPLEEPPTTAGGSTADVAGRCEETREGEPNVLQVEMKDGTTRVPDVEDVKQGVVELKDGGNCVGLLKGVINGKLVSHVKSNLMKIRQKMLKHKIQLQLFASFSKHF